MSHHHVRNTVLPRLLVILPSVSALLLSSACIIEGEELDPFFESCEDLAVPSPPPPPMTCEGPDAAGWTNDVRPNTEPCPPPSPDGCTQVVIGRLFDTELYIDCPGYIVLHRTDWTLDLNDQFIGCVAATELGTCDPPAIVVSERDSIPDYGGEESTVTSRELCQLFNAGCTVTFAGSGGPGYIVCDSGPPPGFAGSCEAGALEGAGCYNYTGSTYEPEQIRTICTTQEGGGIYRETPCPTTNAMGECLLFAGTPTEYAMVFYYQSDDPVERAEQQQGMADACLSWPAGAGGPGQWTSY